MTDRNYRAHAATADTSIAVGDLPPSVFGAIDQLAYEHDVSRCKVARALLEEVAREPEKAGEIIRSKLGEAKRKRRVKHLYANGKAQKRHARPRSQDQVCAELHGSVPAGGCRYPNCDCKA